MAGTGWDWPILAVGILNIGYWMLVAIWREFWSRALHLVA